MRIQSAPLDDLHQEAQVTLQANGGRLAMALLRLASYIYRLHRWALLLILRRHWATVTKRGAY